MILRAAQYNITELVDDTLAWLTVYTFASTLSHKAAGIWHQSRETEAGLFGATISENLEKRIEFTDLQSLKGPCRDL